MDRRDFLKAVGIAGVTGLAGCTGGPTEDGSGDGGGDGNNSGDGGGDGNNSDGGGDGNNSGGDGGGDVAANVGMVYATGGLGDGSFNDQAQTGARKAKEQLNVEFDESQPDEVSQFGQFQQQYAQSTNPNYDLVCCIGFLQKDSLAENAPQFTDQNFMIVDEVVEENNVESYVFSEHEGSFQVGHLAGLLTTMEFEAGAGSTDDAPKVGFVGGVESPLIKKFEAGYLAGVKHANPDINTPTAYVGDFNDIAGGKEAALAMYNDGVDIIYHASGNTGTGVFQAAQESGRFAIGVDSDQSKTKSSYADVILASMVKRVDTAVYTSIENVVNDNFNGGKTTSLGLEREGVGTVYGQNLGSEIPDDVKSKLQASREKIVAGDITVPQDPSNV